RRAGRLDRGPPRRRAHLGDRPGRHRRPQGRRHRGLTPRPPHPQRGPRRRGRVEAVSLGRAATAALLITVAALGACGGGGTSVPKNIRAVGRVSGSDAFVAVAKYGDGVDAYVCDGKAVAETFAGNARGGRIDL